jgi:hypothetical protein
MGFFGGIGNKENVSNTTNQTTNTYTDTSANAGGDGSIAASQNSSINIQNLSESVANTALNDTAAVATNALGFNSDVTRTALSGGYNLARDLVNSGVKQTEFTVNTLAGLQETSARENQDARNAAQNAIDSNVGLTSQLNTLTSAALDKAQAPEAASVALIIKPVLWALGIVFAIFALTVFGRPKKKAKE